MSDFLHPQTIEECQKGLGYENRNKDYFSEKNSLLTQISQSEEKGFSESLHCLRDSTLAQ